MLSPGRNRTKYRPVSLNTVNAVGPGHESADAAPWPPARTSRSSASGARVTSRRAEGVLVEPPGLQDDRQVSSLVLEHGHVGQRIAVHDQQVGQGARGNDAQLADATEDLGAHHRR